MSQKRNPVAHVQESKDEHFWPSYIILSVVPIVGLIVGSFTISAMNWNSQLPPNTPCGTTSWMPLPVWLLVFAIVETVYLIKSLIAAIYRKTHPKIFTYGAGINVLLMIIWIIIGAVVLFRDGVACETSYYSLWAMVCAVVGLYFVLWGIYFLCCCCLCCCVCCAACVSGKSR